MVEIVPGYRAISTVLAGVLIFMAGCGENQVKQLPVSSNCIQTKAFRLKKQLIKENYQLPAELLPYETVEIFPKVEGFIQNVYVDRGTFIKNGQILATLIAPELESKIAEARSQVQSATEKLNESKSQALSSKAVYERIANAAKTPGAISENELETSFLTMKAAQSKVRALQKDIMVYRHALTTLQRINNYLTIKAPISGVVTTRNLHPGALVGPTGAGADEPIFKIDQLSHLRLVLPIPERLYSSVKIGDTFQFKVPAYPGKIFKASVSRPSYEINRQYRTEFVELDYFNKDFPKQAITPGMFAQVDWKVRHWKSAFIVPVSAIAQNSERMFVIKIVKEQAHWVDIKRGYSDGHRVEIYGNLHSGDVLLTRASDDIEDGSCLNILSYEK